jgi:hypothetical protein
VTTDNCLLYAGHTFLCGIIPGPTSKNIEVFLGPLLEELMEAYEEGFDVYDALLKEAHVAHVVLLCAVFDLRGITKFTSSSQHPSVRSCHACNSQGQYLKELHTTTYDDAYTGLPPGHPLRHKAFQHLPVEYKLDVFTKTSTNKKTGKETTTTKPNHYKLDVDSVAAPAKTHNQVLADGLATERDPKLLKSTGQSKRPFATCLSYWDTVRQVHACIMHEGENMGKLLAKAQQGLKQANMTGKRLAMERRRGRWLNLREGGGPKAPKAPFVLSKTETELIVRDLRNLQVPRTHGGFIRNYLKDYSHIRAHDWKLLLGEMLIYLMRHVVSDEYAKLWCDLASIFRTIHSYRITLAELDGLRRDITLWRVRANILLPSSFSTYVVHYLSHIPDTIEELGPAFTTWMYGNETLNGILTSFSHATKDVEICMVRKWLLYKAAFFHRVDSPGQHAGTVPVASDPSSWAFTRGKTHTCSAEELAGFSSVLPARALYQYARFTRKVFNGIKAFRSIPATELQTVEGRKGHAPMWQSGKATVQIDGSALPSLNAVNGYLYGTVHEMFLYGVRDQEHIIFKVCIWKAKLPDRGVRVQLTGVQVPSTFTEFVYVLGSTVSSIVCLFLPADDNLMGGHNQGRYSHYVVHVNAL